MNVLSLATLLCLQAPAPQEAPGAPPATLALLVGVATYAATPDGDTLAPLQGPENDVLRARMLLEQRFGFAPDSIVSLVGTAATHEAIVRTFDEHLIRKAGKGTRVVFWFSGHGSRVPDASQRDPSARGSSEAAQDSTLVAYDSRAAEPEGGYDLTDDELHSLLRAVGSDHILVVTDCCHSGGVLRGPGRAGIRSCAVGTRPAHPEQLPFWPQNVPFVDDDVVDAPPERRHVVHVAACGAEQEAGEKTTPIGTFGTLTWYLSQALLTCEPGTTWATVGARTRAWVSGDGDEPAQLVEVAGETSRLVLAGTGKPVPPGYVCDRFGTRGFTIGAGRLHGLGAGSELRLVDFAAREVGTATVSAVRATLAEASWNGDGEIPDGPLRALPKAPMPAGGPLSLRLGDGVDPGLLAGCAAATVAVGTIADGTIVADGSGYRLVDAAGRQLRPLPGDRDGLHTALFREHAFRRLWHGIAEPGRFPLRIEVAPASDADVATYRIARAPLRAVGGLMVATAAPIDHQSQSGGGLVRIRVHNDSDEDLHVAVISVAENRAVSVLLGRQRDNVVGAHAQHELVAWIGPPFDWPPTQPFLDRYVAIGTARFADFLPYESTAEPGAVRGARSEEPWGVTGCDLKVLRPTANPDASGTGSGAERGR